MTAPTTWVELDLGDSEILVREFPDGVFEVRLNDMQILGNASQVRDLAAQFANLARAKEWL